MEPKDRGTIKWTALMMPEHVEMIQKLWKEDEGEEKKVLDESQVEENSFALQRAMNDGLPVELKYHNGFKYISVKVKIKGLDPYTKKVRCAAPNKESLKVKFEDIFKVIFL
ncbi:YolD-like family protein [Halobacillus naozhouensis]|uniref:YolD-like family protein n=1 Tax=Halobacillus naozhouensis TaxID=554880 RepID=A0ABY8J5U1_9BACI|nr:YolD-like family protein [Halobacillus naozhouensis]WFT76266.1 YolD-like family protein [Halobacillus naozhouensis]